MAEQRVKRRLAAILAADVVGYSRMMREDETGTLAQLKALRREVFDPKTEQYGGRIFKSTGDGALSEFASAVDALQCAVDVQRALARRNDEVPENRKLILRIGISLGDVIVDGDDVFGDGVNVAARVEAMAEPGGISVSGSVYEHVRGKVDIAFLDTGEQSVKNISEPIRIYRIELASQATPAGDAQPVAEDADFLKRPTLAVLPFESLSGDPEQTYFADGLTEDIITALSLWRSFPVIARNSTFVHKGKAVDVQEVGRALGARYVLEGSVRRAGDRVRVTAQLIDADTGHHVWAERFDRQVEDVFDLQDELTAKIAAIVAPELERAEQRRLQAKRPVNLDAWYYVQRGNAHLDEYSKNGNASAREMFSRALDIDPNYGRAFSGISLSYSRDLLSGNADPREATIEKALKAARQAVSLDPTDSLAHAVLGMALLWAGQLEDAIESRQRAVELNPSDGAARAALGNLLDLAGRSDEGISMMEDGLRLNPGAPNINHYYSFLARACVNARRYEEAVTWARKGIQSNPDYPNAYYLMAVALAHSERPDAAKVALDQCESRHPGFVASRADWCPYQDAAANQHIHDGLRKVGLPK